MTTKTKITLGLSYTPNKAAPQEIELVNVLKQDQVFATARTYNGKSFTVFHPSLPRGHMDLAHRQAAEKILASIAEDLYQAADRGEPIV